MRLLQLLLLGAVDVGAAERAGSTRLEAARTAIGGLTLLWENPAGWFECTVTGIRADVGKKWAVKVRYDPEEYGSVHSHTTISTVWRVWNGRGSHHQATLLLLVVLLGKTEVEAAGAGGSRGVEGGDGE